MAPHEGGARVLRRQSVEPPCWLAGELLIRRYEPADRAAVLALHRVALAEVGLRPGDGVYYDDDLGRIEQVYLCGGGDLLVGVLRGVQSLPCPAAPPLAQIGADLVAMVGLRPLRGVHDGSGATDEAGGSGGVGEMVRLRVHPRVQRRGYGTAMVLALEERARELGYRVLRGDTTERQQAALALYRRQGWHETGRRRIGSLVNVYIEKTLGAPIESPFT